VQPDSIHEMERLKQQLPLDFLQNMKRHVLPQSHPPGAYFGVPVHVALYHRNLGAEWKDKLTFCLGGSTLDVLANQKIKKKDTYVGARIVGTNIIMICKHSPYNMNLNDVGFQFERWVTGKQLNDRHSTELMDHIQLMQVGSHYCLFGADCDATHQGAPVEIKTTDPKQWKTKTMFQMISSGSQHLVYGKKAKGGTRLLDVQILSLEEVASRSSKHRHGEMERNIVSGLDQLRACWDDLGQDDYEMKSLHFEEGSWRLKRFNKPVTPPTEVLRQLMSAPSQS